MEHIPDQFSRKPLRVMVPPTTDKEVDVVLTGDAVLTLDERRARDIALSALASQRRVAPPDNEAIL